ncbi:hypothetical protein, partial [Clostridium sp.]|uniref:hypothetical protein n=1 Tax=Clostridium sp. TaxID=1506 RepID=UPI003F2BF958
SLILSLTLNCNFNFNTSPPLIDAYILAYDAMYNRDNQTKKDFIILDMESNFFENTTYEERQKVIEHFNKYNKHVLNASLFKLKEIGLANKRGDIIINGDLLTMNCVRSNGEGSLIIEGVKYHGVVSAYFYKITLKTHEGSWIIDKIEELGVA